MLKDFDYNDAEGDDEDLYEDDLVYLKDIKYDYTLKVKIV